MLEAWATEASASLLKSLAHSTSAISRCLLCRPRTDDPTSVPSSVLPPGPNTQKETGKMKPKMKEEKEVEEGDKQSTLSPRMGPSARLVTVGPREEGV